MKSGKSYKRNLLLAATIVSLSSTIPMNIAYADQPTITPTRGASSIYSIIDGEVTGNNYNFKITDGTNTYYYKINVDLDKLSSPNNNITFTPTETAQDRYIQMDLPTGRYGKITNWLTYDYNEATARTSAEHYPITAETISGINGKLYKLTPGSGNEVLTVGNTGDVDTKNATLNFDVVDHGGMVYASNHGHDFTIGKISGNLVKTDYGAILKNYSSSNETNTVDTIEVNAIGNLYGTGGMIENRYKSVINNINSNFIANTGSGEGVIFNSGSTINSINSDFIGNTRAIYNNHHSADLAYIGSITGDFIGNYQAIINDNSNLNPDGHSKIDSVNGMFIGNYVGSTSVNAEVFGGAIKNSDIIETITGDFIQNYAFSGYQNAYGGAIYNDGTIGKDNGYGFATEGGIIDSSFIGNFALSNSYSKTSYGGAIYNSANSQSAGITAQTKDVSFIGNIADVGAAIYNESISGIQINATGGNIVFRNNNSNGTSTGTGSGIYSTSTLFLNTSNGHSITIDDNINVNGGNDHWGYINMQALGGDINLNGNIETGSNAGLVIGSNFADSTGSVNLGVNAANSTHNSLQYSSKAKLSLQNDHAGDNLVIGALGSSGWEPELKLNIDYDATSGAMDKLTVNGGSGKITLNAVNVLNDNASFVDGTEATYLDGTARNNVTVISDAITSTIAGTTVYTFTPDSTTHGLLTVTRAESYAGDLIDAIQDTQTVHPTAYSMQGDFTADRNFGALNTENREQFTIFGNNHTISGDNNTYTGIEVASGQTLNLDNVRFSNVKTYDVQNAGTLNLSGTNTINKIAGATGTTNITGGATWIKGGSVTQNTINLKGGDLVLDLSTSLPLTPGTITANIVGDGTVEKTGIILNSGTINGTISGTFKGNNDTALANFGTVGNITADFVNNTATVLSSNAKGGAIYNEGGTLGTISGNFTGNSATNSSGDAYGGAIYQSGGTLTINGATFGGTEAGQGNSATSSASGKYGYGGAIYLTNATATITDSNFENNSAMLGGAIYQDSGSLTLNNATFKNNTGNIGSSIYQKSGTLSITGSTFDNTNSGNLWQESGNLSITGSNFTNTGVTSRLGSNVTISGTTFDNSPVHFLGKGNETSASYQNTFSIVNSTIQNVTASHSNAYALSVCGGDVTIDGINIINNTNARGIKSEAAAQSAGDYTHYSKLNIIAQTADVNITGNKEGVHVVGWNNDDHYHTTLSLYAKNHDILISGNTDRGLSYYDQYGSLTLNADTGHNITINDSVSSNVGMTINNGGTHAGTVALNGDLANAGAISVGGGTLELGSTAVTSLANAIETNNGTVKLTGGTLTQNIAGATTITGTVIDNNATLGDVTILGTANFTDNGGTFTTADNAGTFNVNGVLIATSINNTGTLNFGGTNNNISAITGDSGVTNINSGTLWIEDGSVTQNTINLKGGNLLLSSDSVANANIVAYGTTEKSGTLRLNTGSTLNGSISGTFKNNDDTALYQDGGNLTLNNVGFDSNTSSTSAAALLYTGTGSGTITGSQFVNNASLSSGNIYGGAAVFGNTGASTITNGAFTNNSVISTGNAAWGGAIYEENVALTINGTEFKKNFAGTTSGNAGGGAIDHEGGSLTISGATFGGVDSTDPENPVSLGNSVVSNNGYAYGGAIYQTGGSLSVTDTTFDHNSVTATSGNAYGGAIYNYATSGATINGTFTNNLAKSTGSQAFGGAIANFVSGASISGSFDGNKVESVGSWALGGAIGSTVGLTITDTSFTNNTAVAYNSQNQETTGGRGGAIYIQAGDLTINADTQDVSISGNKASAGGGIYMGDGNVTINAVNKDVTLENNVTAVNGGGAIYMNKADKAITLNAQGGNIYVRGNGTPGYYSFGIQSNQGDINLNASTGRIVIDDRIYAAKNLNINDGTTGIVEINNIISGATSGHTTNIKGGTLKLGAGAGTSGLGAVTFTNTPTVDLQNGSAQKLYTASVNGIANLNIDIDFTGTSVIADSINIYTGGQTGVITLDKIAALSSNEDIRTFENLEILTGQTEGVTLALSTALQNDTRFNIDDGAEVTYTSDYNDNVTFGQFTGDKFTTTEWTETFKKKLTVDEETNTKLSFTKTSNDDKHSTGTTQQDVLQALNQSTSDGRYLNATETNKNYTVGADLGTTGAGTLTVQGVEGSTLDMNSKTGFELTNANTVLNLSDLTITGLADENTSLIGIANVTGTKANLENITVSQTITKDVITNLGELNFSGTNTINSYIGGTGTTNINGGKTTLAKFVQNVVNISSGELEVANITATNGIFNDGTLTLTGNANANTISGTGHTTIAGNVNNTGAINQAVEVSNTGTLTSTVANLGGTITNLGTLNLSGTLDKAISGEGETIANSDLTFRDGASVAGKLDINGKTVIMSGDNAATTYQIGTLEGDGNISIDLLNNGTSIVADAIQATTYTSGQTITITALNDSLGDSIAPFTVEVLKGNSTGVTLALADSIKNNTRYNLDADHATYAHKAEADEVGAEISWTAYNKIGTRQWDEAVLKTLDVDGGSLVYTETVDTKNYVANEEDAIAFMNKTTQFGTTAKKMIDTASSPSNITLSGNIGSTTGSFTLKGIKTADAISTVNFKDADNNAYKGFEVGGGAALTLDTVKLTNASSTTNGAVINSASGSTVNIINAQFADNTSAKGGAVYNSGVMNISGTSVFENNSTNKSSGVGGAVWNNGTLSIIGDVNNKVRFVNNSTTKSSSNGGAVFNAANGLLTLNYAEFENNKSYANGGAISNINGTLLADNSLFRGNSATTLGGVLQNSSTIDSSVSNSIFSGNYTGGTATTPKGSGGAIWHGSTGKLTLTNDTFDSNGTDGTSIKTSMGGAVYNNGSMEIKGGSFTKNKAGSGAAIYNAKNSTLTVNNVTIGGSEANGNVSLETGGAIHSVGNLTIDNSTISYNKTYSKNSLNAEMGDGGAIYSKNVLTVTNSTIEHNIAQRGGGIFNSTDTTSTGNLTIKNSSINDNLSYNNGGGIYNNGVLNIEDTNFTNNTAQGKGGAIYNLANKTTTITANTKDVSFSGNKASYVDETNYIANDVNNLGTLILNTVGDKTITFEGGITGIDDSSPEQTDLGTTQVVGNVITAFIEQKEIDIQSGKLTSTGNVIVRNNITNAVEGGLELQGGTLTANVTGDGSTVINSTGTVTIGTGGLISQTVAIQAGTLKTGVNGFTQNITSNSGIVELTGTGTLTQTIAGNTTVSGTDITNNGSLANVTIADGGVLTSASDKISGTINNGGTLKLSGTLNKAISGNGETIANADLTLGTSASVTGTLNANSKALIMSGDSAATQTNVGTLKGAGTLSVDVINNSGTIVSDSIKATTYDNSIAFVVNNMTGFDDVVTGLTLSTTTGENVGFNLNVLNGYEGNGLTIADAYTTAYHNVGKNVDRAQTDELTSTANWTDQFGESTWQDQYKQTLTVSNGTIAYNIVKTGETTHVYDEGDTLQMLNTTSQFGTTERKFVTTDAGATYDVTADSLGATAAGTMTVKGATNGTNTSTIDMKGKTGFVVGEGATVNLDTVNITGTKTADGSLINNTAGEVNLNNVSVATNTNDVIANNSTMNLTGSNDINSGITGTGTTNVKSGTSIIDRITQKVVEIFGGSKLETETVTASEQVKNAGDLTITGTSNSSKITGTGTTEFKNNVNNSGDISQGTVKVADGKTLTTTGDITTDTLTNGGTVTLNSADTSLTIKGGTAETPTTIAGTINGTGSTVIEGNAQNNGIIASAVEIATSGKLSTNADKVTGAINNGGNLDLTGGDIKNAISGDGNTTISGTVTNTTGSAIGNAVTVATTGNLTTAADKLGGTVENNGTTNGLTLTGGQLSQNVTGTGKTVIAGTDVSVKYGNSIAQDIEITSGNKLVNTNVSAIGGDVENNGNIQLYSQNNGKLEHNITGSGTTELNRDITVAANIDNTINIKSYTDGTGTHNANITVESGNNFGKAGQNITVDSNNSLTMQSASDIKGNLVDNGTVELQGGTISSAISGSGAVNITGNIINNAANTVTGAVSVAENVELAIGTSGNTFNSASSLTMGNGSTLNLQNGSADIVNDNLAVATDKIANLAMDWGDKISGTNISGTLNVSSIDLTKTVDGTTTGSYGFITDANYANAIINESVNLKTNSATNSFNSVSYNASTGLLSGAKNALKDAVANTEDGENAIYAMSADEPAGALGAGVLDGGKLIVQGNGNTITGYGIEVGDGTHNAILTIKDANMKNITGDALLVKGGNTVTVMAENSDIEISGTTGNAIKLNKDTNGNSIVNIEGGSHTVTIENDIISDNSGNTVKFNSGTINFNGKFDPAAAVVGGATVNRGGDDDGIDWTVTSGTLNYLQDSYLNRATNTMNLNGGTLNTVNGVVTDFALGGFTLSNDSNFYADVDLAAGKMDNFLSTPTTYTGGTLHVAGLNLISDATADNTSIPFANSTLAGHVDYTGAQGLTALSPIYKYNVGYNSSNGNFDFARYNSGGYDGLNPAIMAAPVAAQMGGYLTQLNSYDEAFRNMDMYMLMTAQQRQALKNKNKVASIDGGVLYDATLMRQERAEGWFRPFATFEKVGLRNGPKVENIAYGTYMGGESQMYDLGHGWDGIWGAYVGYNGSHQNYDGVSIYQNGGTLGVLGMAYKGNFFTGLTINAGASGVEASTMYGNEDFAMLMAGIASKTGYNWELFNGKFIIQPSMLMSYSFVNTFDYKNAAGVNVDSDPLHAIQLQPEIKFIGNLKNGWQPYASVAMVWNIMDNTKFKANDVSLPELSVKPYVKYGVGVRKTWGERLTGFFQTYLTNGGRNGVGLQAGFTWAFGGGKNKKADEKKIQKSLNKTPELKKTEIVLNGKKVQ